MCIRNRSAAARAVSAGAFTSANVSSNGNVQFGSSNAHLLPKVFGRVHPRFQPYDLSIPDNKRVDVWLEEFRQFSKKIEADIFAAVTLEASVNARKATGGTARLAVEQEIARAAGVVDALAAHVALVGQRIVSTQRPDLAVPVVAVLREQGAEVIELPATEFRPAADRGAFDTALGRWLGAPRMEQRITDGTFVFTPDASREERLEAAENARRDAASAIAASASPLTRPSSLNGRRCTMLVAAEWVTPAGLLQRARCADWIAEARDKKAGKH